jgi:glycosyltransferase involved in cell wall biosynthesis
MESKQLISFCINTARNEINHIKLLLKSLEVNLSTKEHEIIVFIDSDNQGTFEWLLTQKEVFPNLKILKNHLPICYGYALNINEMIKQAKHDVISYLQSDMVVCKDYDLGILKHIKPNTFLCSTRIEPPLHPSGPEKVTYDFGLDPTQFDLDVFTEFAELHKQDKITEYYFAPFSMYKDVWLSIGGHDTRFRRSREDSDALIRLVLNNTKIEQTWLSLVYHFTCTSSRGVDWFNPENQQAQEKAKLQSLADIFELNRFTMQWGAFSHDGTTKQKFYEISAKILGKNIPLEIFMSLERFFHKVYVEDTSIIPLVQNEYNQQQKIANRLFNMSDEEWDKYGYIINQPKASERIKSLDLDTSKDDIIIEFNGDQHSLEYTNDFLVPLQKIIDQTDGNGKFEYGPFIITINKKQNRASEHIKITNPDIKPEHLYHIY